MTTYNRSERLTWRSRCRRWRWMVNAMLAVLVLAVLLASAGLASVATAAPACPGGVRPGPGGECVARIDRNTVCAWPMVLVRIGRTTYCVRMAVQP